MIINKLLVEAARVELITMLITRKLLILGTATTGKKGRIAQSIVRLLYENAFARSRTGTTQWPQYPIDSSRWRKKYSSSSTAVALFHYFRVARDAGTIGQPR